MPALTIAEKILSARSGRSANPARAGEIVVCDVDCVIGTDGSAPMAIDYFERMAGESARVKRPERVFFSLDHYAPPTTDQTRAFHEKIRTFAAKHGATVFGVGDGISFVLAAERGAVHAGDLVVGADSHTVTCGALNCFAIGVGSSDLAAAMLTGQIWLRVPETIRVMLSGRLAPGVMAKDLGLSLIAELGADGADYCAIEFDGDAVASIEMHERFVISNLMVEAGAKAAVFPRDAKAAAYARSGSGVSTDSGARYCRVVTLDLASLTPRVALPHQPDNVVPLSDAAGTAVQMVFVGTCTGGHVPDYHIMRAAFDAAGGKVAPGVHLVLTPATRSALDELTRDGTIDHLVAAGAVLTTVGCGACCGTSGVIPGDGMTVLSTANRNFKARMGNATVKIYLASPAACGIAAATGVIPGSVAPPTGDDDATGARGAS
jgi:3-isopropylmalate/(R)-2-methylmalate dehydratase large subunit